MKTTKITVQSTIQADITFVDNGSNTTVTVTFDAENENSVEMHPISCSWSVSSMYPLQQAYRSLPLHRRFQTIRFD